MSIADELQKLQQLHESGAISDEELRRRRPGCSMGTSGAASSRCWAATPSSSRGVGDAAAPVRVRHIRPRPLGWSPSQSLIWQIKKSDLPEIHCARQDRGQLDDQLALIYAIACVLLRFVLIGFPLLMVLGVLVIVFPGNRLPAEGQQR